jgi:hypothetical protein
MDIDDMGRVRASMGSTGRMVEMLEIEDRDDGADCG